MSLSQLKSLIQSDLDAVESLIEKKLSAEQNQSIREINDYILSTPGKRIRPSLAILAFRSLWGSNTIPEKTHKQLIYTAAALEFIHMASLVHDDVIDHAPVRHNRPSIDAKYGKEVAIPIGVYLYSISLNLLSEAGDLDVLSIISHAVKTLCAGELGQVLDRDQLISIPQYLAILKKKTGILFSAACQCGALLAGVSKKERYHFKHYGNYLGLSFQIIDDVMDILGDEKELKKEAGQDFDLGEVTLPILYLIENGDEDEKRCIMTLLRDKSMASFNEIQDKIKSSKTALPQTENLANHYLDRASKELSFLKTSRYKMAMIAIISFIKTRGFKEKANTATPS